MLFLENVWLTETGCLKKLIFELAQCSSPCVQIRCQGPSHLLPSASHAQTLSLSLVLQGTLPLKLEAQFRVTTGERVNIQTCFRNAKAFAVRMLIESALGARTSLDQQKGEGGRTALIFSLLKRGFR